MDQQHATVASSIAGAMHNSSALGPVPAVEQICVLLYLKLLDEYADQYDLSAGRDSEPQTPLFQLQAERYRWRSWRDLPAQELRTFLSEEVLPYMSSLEREAPHVAAFFRDAELEIVDADLLSKVVRQIDTLHLTKLVPEEAGRLLDRLLDQLGWREVDGIYRTSPALRDLMVRMTAPGPGKTVFDPAMGTAGLLADAASHVRAGGGKLPRLRGSEVSRTLLRIATVNLALRGLPTTGLGREDALMDDGPWKSHEPADVILCDPPFGPRPTDHPLDADYAGRSRRLEGLFLEIAMRRLAPDGRASVLVPDGILQDGLPAHVTLREALVEKFDVLSVLSLPPGRFRAHAGLRSSLLTFRPACGRSGRRPDRVWFYRLGGGPRQRPNSAAPEGRTGLADFLRSWDRHAERDFLDPPGARGESVLPAGSREPRSWWVSREDLAAGSYRLDASRWAPRVADWPLDRDPADLVHEAVDKYRRLLAELEDLAGELTR
ncbi:N-6 DNA methylase [Sphingomonas melonis]